MLQKKFMRKIQKKVHKEDSEKVHKEVAEENKNLVLKAKNDKESQFLEK